MTERKSNKIQRFSQRINTATSTAFSTILLSLGCAFVSSYDNSLYIGKINYDKFFVFNVVAYVISNPFVYIFWGAVVLIFSEYGNHLKKDELSRLNGTLSTKENQNESIISILKDENSLLKRKINIEQEMSQELRVKICDVHIKQITTWLKGVYKQMDFTSDERVSIYFEVNQEFHILDRYSSNPSYKRIHKQRFSVDQGVISKSWQKGLYHEASAPPYSESEKLYYEYMMQKYGFNENEISNLNMKSCRLLGVSITEADENIGVILFESTSEKALSECDAEKILDYCKNYQSHLCGFVKDSILYNRELEVSKAVSRANTDQEVLSELGGNNEK